jgi:hypothetical protein
LKTFALIAAVLIAGYVVWGLVYPMGTWRYRLTIEVDTPEGVKSGSSVIEVRAARQPKLTPETTTDIGISGEAVVVDLGEGKYLFCLLTSPDLMSSPAQFVFDMYPFRHSNGKPGGQTTPEGIAYYSSLYSKLEGAKRDVLIDALPMLVQFSDINDPETVEIVNPRELAKILGDGFRFKSAKVKMVDSGIWPLTMFDITGEPVTRKIKNILPWLSNYPEPVLLTHARRDGSDRRPEVSLIHGHFSR